MNRLQSQLFDYENVPQILKCGHWCLWCHNYAWDKANAECCCCEYGLTWADEPNLAHEALEQVAKHRENGDMCPVCEIQHDRYLKADRERRNKKYENYLHTDSQGV
jgi:hypothetical protein